MEWKYEEEFRVIKIDTQGLLPFKKEALTEIIFGINSSENDIKDIMKLVIDKNFQVTYKKTQRKNREFGIDIIDF